MDRAGFWQKPGPLALLRGWARDGVPAEEIARKALHIAASICVFTNDHITVEVIGRE